MFHSICNRGFSKSMWLMCVFVIQQWVVSERWRVSFKSEIGVTFKCMGVMFHSKCVGLVEGVVEVIGDRVSVGGGVGGGGLWLLGWVVLGW